MVQPQKLNKPVKMRYFSLRTICLLFCGLLLTETLFADSKNTSSNNINLKFIWTNLPSNIEDNVDSAIKSLAQKIKENNVQLPKTELNKLTIKTIKNAMSPYGYFTPRITIHNTVEQPYTVLHITITKGKPVLIRHINIVIQSKENAWKILSHQFPLKTGEVLQTEPYQDYKNQLFSLASDSGYFNAQMKKNVITINRKKHWADIEIIFDPKTRFRYAKSVFKSNYLKTSFLQRYIKYKKGEYFNSKDLLHLQTNLQNSEYFSYVDIIPNPNPKTHTVDIDIKTKTGDRYNYILGAGYGTDTGVRGTIGVQILPVNKRGHTFQIMTKLAPQYSLVDGTYAIPGRDPVNTQYSAFARINQYIVPIGTSLSTQLGIALKHIYHPFSNHILTQLFQIYKLNEKSNYSNSNAVNQSLNIGSAEFTIGPPISSLGAQHIIQWSISSLFARKVLGSPIDLTQYQSNFFFMRIFAEKWRLVLGNEFALTQAKNLLEIPISLQLLTGGDNSVRGYPYGSIGPGKYLSTISVTFQREVYTDWYFGGFYDMGSASNRFFNDIKQSAGPTLTRMTPIGGLTLSLAKPIHDPSRNKWGLSFSWGTRL